jgi:hypothetical protein
LHLSKGTADVSQQRRGPPPGPRPPLARTHHTTDAAPRGGQLGGILTDPLASKPHELAVAVLERSRVLMAETDWRQRH